MSRFLNELDAKNLLSQYGMPMAESFAAHSAEEAKQIAAELAGLSVMKILSPDIQHKTDAGCVMVGVSPDQAETAYETILKNAKNYDEDAKVDGILVQEMAPPGVEVILGVKQDPQFGPVIMAGSGGIYVEVFADITLRLLPISRADAREMIRETKLSKIIHGARGTIYDEDALIDALMAMSALVHAKPEIEEIDLNPLFLYEEGKGAEGVDALIKVR